MSTFKIKMSEFGRETPVKIDENKQSPASANGQDLEKQQLLQSLLDKGREQEISDSMREKLKREIQSQGGDPNFSRGPIVGNPILIISVIVAVLVALGGKDIFF